MKSFVAIEAAISAGAFGLDRVGDGAFAIGGAGFSYDTDVYSESRADLMKYWNTGLPGGTAYMAGTKSAASKWINIFNPEDGATNLAWRTNNLSKHFLNRYDPEVPDLESLDEGNAWVHLLNSIDWVDNLDGLDAQEMLETLDWRLLPSSGIWPWRYVIELDEVAGHRYYRLPHPVDSELAVDAEDWVNISGGLVDGRGQPGIHAYEIIAFMSQANVETVGNVRVPDFFDTNTDFGQVLGIMLPVADSAFQNHSFQFHYDIATTWPFWEHVKEETEFAATY